MPEEPVRILYLDHTGELGGAERVLLDVLPRLDRARVEPILAASPEGELLDRARGLGIEVVPLGLDEAARTLSREAWGHDPLSFVWRARGYLNEARRLAAVMRERRVDAVHTNTLKAHVLGGMAARLARRPLVWHMHDLPSTRGDTRNLLDHTARFTRPDIVAVSAAVAADLSPAVRARTRVVHNGLDLAAFDRAATRPDPPLPLPPGDGPVVGAMSYLIPWKGHEVFLRAMKRMLEARPELRFVIVGEPIFQWRDERDRLEAIARELGVADRVAFAGHREDAPAVLGAFDLFVMPSLFEPFGRVLIEAMAAARPIVASRAGGVPEIVVDGETGLLVPPGDDAALAEAVLALLADPARAARLGEAGRRRVAASFSLDAQVAGLMAAYEAFGILAPDAAKAGVTSA